MSTCPQPSLTGCAWNNDTYVTPTHAHDVKMSQPVRGDLTTRWSVSVSLKSIPHCKYPVINLLHVRCTNTLFHFQWKTKKLSDEQQNSFSFLPNPRRIGDYSLYTDHRGETTDIPQVSFSKKNISHVDFTFFRSIIMLAIPIILNIPTRKIYIITSRYVYYLKSKSWRFRIERNDRYCLR